MQVRPETPADHARVDEIQKAAFGRAAEARLVTVLREEVSPQLSLVAVDAGQVVGHVFFSPVHVDGNELVAAGLGPLAVDPAHQGRGAGGALVRAGLAACPDLGWEAVFLLGNPAYYSRFGFTLAAARDLHYESADFDGGFQVRELRPGALEGCRGFVRYAPGFADT
ncbi:MAG: N-acetyltransferase [Proteobacteria bacterium]|nr:N-acetyltransferase [Pseudomonadota bacterium]